MFSSFVQNSFELVPSISFAINAFYLTWLSRLRSHTASAHKMKITDYKKRFGADPELLEVVFHRYKKLVQLTISQQRCGVCIFASMYNCIRIFNTKVQSLYLCLYPTTPIYIGAVFVPILCSSTTTRSPSTSKVETTQESPTKIITGAGTYSFCP